MGSVNTKQPQIDVDNFHIVIIDYDLWRYENWEYGKIRLETGWRWQPGDGTCPIRDATTWTPSTSDQKSVQGFLVVMMMMFRKWSNLEFSRFSDVRNLPRYKAHIYVVGLFIYCSIKECQRCHKSPIAQWSIVNIRFTLWNLNKSFSHDHQLKTVSTKTNQLFVLNCFQANVFAVHLKIFAMKLNSSPHKRKTGQF